MFCKAIKFPQINFFLLIRFADVYRRKKREILFFYFLKRVIIEIINVVCKRLNIMPQQNSQPQKHYFIIITIRMRIQKSFVLWIVLCSCFFHSNNIIFFYHLLLFYLMCHLTLADNVSQAQETNSYEYKNTYKQ